MLKPRINKEFQTKNHKIASFYFKDIKMMRSLS